MQADILGWPLPFTFAPHGWRYVCCSDRAVVQGKPVTSIAAGAEHSVVSVESGEVYAWGWGRYGNVGDGERADR